MKLFFQQHGEGDNIIILHGLYGSSDNWMTVARKLAHKHSVYSLDLRNHGRSPHSNTHSYKELCADLHEFFVEHNLQKATILGHSMGGKLAMLFARSYPHMVDKLIVADIAPKDYLTLGENSQIHEHRHILKCLIDLSADAYAFASRQELLAELEKQLGIKELVMFLSKSLPYDRQSKSFKLLINAKVLNAYLNHIICSVTSSELLAIPSEGSFPTLFVRGLSSSYVMDEDIPLIRKVYPQAQIVDLANAGHWLHVEQHDAFMNALTSFIDTE